MTGGLINACRMIPGASPFDESLSCDAYERLRFVPMFRRLLKPALMFVLKFMRLYLSLSKITMPSCRYRPADVRYLSLSLQPLAVSCRFWERPVSNSWSSQFVLARSVRFFAAVYGLAPLNP